MDNPPIPPIGNRGKFIRSGLTGRIERGTGRDLWSYWGERRRIGVAYRFRERLPSPTASL
jgi:hypothetical protein